VAHNHLVHPVEASPANRDFNSLLRHSECLNLLANAHKAAGRPANLGTSENDDWTPGQGRGTGPAAETPLGYKTPTERPKDPSQGRMRRAHGLDWDEEDRDRGVQGQDNRNPRVFPGRTQKEDHQPFVSWNIPGKILAMTHVP